MARAVPAQQGQGGGWWCVVGGCEGPREVNIAGRRAGARLFLGGDRRGARVASFSRPPPKSGEEKEKTHPSLLIATTKNALNVQT